MDAIIDTLHHVWTAFNSLPPEVLTQVSQVIITALIASPLFLGLKKVLIKERERLMALVVIVGSIVAGASIFLATMPNTGIWAEYTALIALIQGIVTYAATQPVWIYVVKPLYRRASVWFASQVATAAALNEIKSAAVPSDGLATDQK